MTTTPNEEIKVTADLSSVEAQLRRLHASLENVTKTVGALQARFDQFNGHNFKELRRELAQLNTALNVLRKGDILPQFRAADIQGQVATFKNQVMKLGEEMALAQANVLSKAQRANKFSLKQQVTEQAVFGGLDLKGKDLDTLKRYEKILAEAKATADISRELEKSKQGMQQLTQVSERLGQVLTQIRGQVQQINQTQAATGSRQQLGLAAQDRDIYSRATRGQIDTLSTAELKRAEKLVTMRAAEARGFAEQLNLRQGMERHAQRALQVEQNLLAVRQQLSLELRKQNAIASWDTTMERIGANGGANLLALQARLMANYAAIGAVTGAFSYATGFVRDFDKELYQLQAISGASTEAMVGLKDTIIGVSQATKFTAVEVAQAATVLSQAGFSVREVQDSLQGVTLLATATGSSLEQAVDVATAAIGVFNMQASEMGQVANVTTQALNLSKLTMEKLATGLQYSSNIAADAGLTYTELTAVLATMANTGIRSGSTMGTGLRQVLIELMDPSKKLRDRFDELGISMADVDLKANGFVGVMENLRAKGFTAADAFALMETRTAAAYSAIARGADSLTEMELAFTLNDAAARANSVQMQSLDTIVRVLASNFGALAEAVSGDLLFALKESLNALSSLVKLLHENEGAVTVLVNGLAALTAVGVGTWLARLAVGFAGTTLGMRHLLDATKAVGPATTSAAAGLSALTTGFTGTTAAAGAATTATTAFRSVLMRLGLVGVIAAGLSFLPEIFAATATEAEKAAAAYDKAAGAFEKVKGEAESISTSISTLTDDIERYTQRAEQLKDGSNALRLAIWDANIRFREQDFFVKSTATYQEFMGELENLRSRLNDLSFDVATDKLDKLDDKIKALNESLKATADLNKNMGFEEYSKLIPQRLEKLRSRNVTVDDVMSILDRVAAGDASVTIGDVQKAAKRLAEQQADITRRVNEGLISGIEAAQARAEVSLMEFLSGQLESARSTMLDLAGKMVERGFVEKEKLQQEFAASDPGEAMTKLFEETRRNLKILNDALKDSNTPEEAEAIAESIRGEVQLFKESFERLTAEAVNAGLGDAMAAAEAGATAGELSDQAEADIKRAMSEHSERVKGFLEGQVQLLELQLKNLMLQAEEGLTNPLKEQIRAVTLAKAEAEGRLIQAKKTDTPFFKLNPQEGEKLANLQAEVSRRQAEKDLRDLEDRAQREADQKKRAAEKEQEQRRRIADKLAKAQIELLEDDMEKTLTLSGQETADDFKKRLATLSSQSEEYIKRSVEEFRKSLEEDKAFEGQGELINRLVAAKERDLYQKVAANSDKLIQAMVAAADRAAQQRNAQREFEANLVQADRAGQSTIRGEANFTEADAFAQREADELLRVAQVQDQINTLRKQSADYSVALAAAEAEQARYGELNVEGQKKITDLKEKILEVDRERILLERELIALSSDEQASLTDRLDAATKLYLQQSGALKTLDTQIVELYSVGLKNLGSGFGSMFKEIATGAKTSGDALHDMVMKFADALLDQTTQNAASAFMSMLNGGKSDSGSGGIFGALLSGIGSLFGGGGSLGRTGYTSGVLGPAGTMIGGRSRGGRVDAADIGRDSVLTPLRGEEFVLQPSAARSVGYDFLEEMNARGAAAIPRDIVPAAVLGGGGGEVNVYVVAPDEQPQMGPNDVIATISRDILTGGTTKRLIKSVAMGQA